MAFGTTRAAARPIGTAADVKASQRSGSHGARQMLQALLAVVTRVLDLDLDVSQLDEAVQRFRARCDQAVARDASVQTHIRQLEQDYDAAGGAAPPAPQADAPHSAPLIQEVEDFLREKREGEGGV